MVSSNPEDRGAPSARLVAFTHSTRRPEVLILAVHPGTDWGLERNRFVVDVLGRFAMVGGGFGGLAGLLAGWLWGLYMTLGRVNNITQQMRDEARKLVLVFVTPAGGDDDDPTGGRVHHAGVFARLGAGLGPVNPVELLCGCGDGCDGRGRVVGIDTQREGYLVRHRSGVDARQGHCAKPVDGATHVRHEHTAFLEMNRTVSV